VTLPGIAAALRSAHRAVFMRLLASCDRCSSRWTLVEFVDAPIVERQRPGETSSRARPWGVPTSFLLDFFFFFFLVPESPLGAGDAPRGGREGGGVSQGIAQKLVPRTSVAIEGLLL